MTDERWSLEYSTSTNALGVVLLGAALGGSMSFIADHFTLQQERYLISVSHADTHTRQAFNVGKIPLSPLQIQIDPSS